MDPNTARMIWELLDSTQHTDGSAWVYVKKMAHVSQVLDSIINQPAPPIDKPDGVEND